MRKKNFILLFIGLLVIYFGCTSDSNGNNEPSLHSKEGTRPTHENSVRVPGILYGKIRLNYPHENKQTLEVDLEPGDVYETRREGIDIKLPEVSSVVEMQVVNCQGFIGVARVKFVGLEHSKAWEAEFVPNKIAADLLNQMKKCNANSLDVESNSPINSVFFIDSVPASKKASIKADPNWSELKTSLSSKWLLAAGLNEKSSDEELMEKISVWTDMDGDGLIDVIRLIIDDKTGKKEGYQNVLKRLDTGWELIWKSQPN